MNCNIEDSPRAVKRAFCDNLYLNVMPKKPDQPNGTALIAANPPLSAALKLVARLRRQFLSYFSEGVFLGGSMLSEPSAGFVRGYQLQRKLLVIVLNDHDRAQPVSVRSDLDLWLGSSKRVRVRYFDESGRVLDESAQSARRWSAVTRVLQPLELAFFELDAE